MVSTLRELCRNARRELEPTEGEQAAVTARELVAYAAGLTAEQLLRQPDAGADERVRDRLEAVLKEYRQDRPLAYILGKWSFYGLELTVNEKVLIPRDDTVAVTELAMEKARLSRSPRVLDLCAGSGCIGLAVAVRLPEARVTLAELSEGAISVARENRDRYGLKNRVQIIRADALATPPACLKAYDVLVSNPPYVTAAEMEVLPRSVAGYEPHLALLGGEDGLDFYRSICRNYRSVLSDGGWLCLEFGMGQHQAVADILAENGFTAPLFRRDASGIIRAAAAQKTERND